MSTSCIDPRGSTLSPENPRRWALTGSSFSLPMPIFSKADAKIISAELPLSTRTRWIVLLATMALITSGSSWGCWQAGSLTYLNLKRLWWCPIEGVWIRLVPPISLLT